MASEQQKQMARRIAADTARAQGFANRHQIFLDGRWDNHASVQAALAAIMETQEACARLAESELVEVYGDSPEIDTECNHLVRRIATAIRTGEHYALAGGGRG